MTTETTLIITQTTMAVSAAFFVLLAAFIVVPWLRHIRDDLNATQKTLAVIQTLQATRKDTGSTKAEKTDDALTQATRERETITAERNRVSLAVATALDAEYPPPPQYTEWAQRSYTEGVNAVLTRLRAALREQ